MLPSTERLTLRHFTPDDLELLVELNGNPDVMKNMGGVMDRPKVEEFFRERILGYYEQNPGLGIWATIERSSGACAGVHLINHIKGEQYLQVGYQLFPWAWGRGYATEMGLAVMRYGYGELKLPNIYAITTLQNTASQRVLEKLGLRRNGDRNFAAYGKSGPMAWFESERESWLASH